MGSKSLKQSDVKRPNRREKLIETLWRRTELCRRMADALYSKSTLLATYQHEMHVNKILTDWESEMKR